MPVSNNQCNHVTRVLAGLSAACQTGLPSVLLLLLLCGWGSSSRILP